MKKKIKVCFYMTTILEHWGGLEKYFIDVANKINQTSKDIEIEIVTMDDNFSINFIKILSIYNLQKIDKSTMFKATKEELKERLGKTKYFKCNSFKDLRNKFNEYDLIYSKNELLEGFIFKFLINYKKIPKVIFGCHTSLYYPNSTSLRHFFRNFLYNGITYKFLASDVYAFHTINSLDYDKAKNLFPNKPILKIYNPFNFSNFIKNSHKYDFNLDKNKINILWIGTLIPLKGTSDLSHIIKEINNIKKYRNKINWIIAGAGPDQPIIDELANSYENVNFLGYVSYEKVPSLIQSINLLISTSKVETFSFTTIEANAVSKPVFSYKTSGQKDIIENNVNGLLLDNEEAMINEIKRYVDGCYNFKDIGNFIIKKFNEDNIYKDLELMFINFSKNKND